MICNLLTLHMQLPFSEVALPLLFVSVVVVEELNIMGRPCGGHQWLP